MKRLISSSVFAVAGIVSAASGFGITSREFWALMMFMALAKITA